MKQFKDFINNYFVWILIIIVIAGFFYLANQSTGEPEVGEDFIIATDQSAMYKGDQDAPVNIVVYTDFLCPYCAQFANETMLEIEKEFIKTGKAKVEVRPLAMIGVDSQLAAEAAYCAADQEAFWQYHDATYAYTQREVFDKNVSTRETSVLTAETLTGIMKKTNSVNTKKFSSCLSDNTHSEAVEKATADANAKGVTGTPYVLVNGNHVQALSFDVISIVIKAQL